MEKFSFFSNFAHMIFMREISSEQIVVIAIMACLYILFVVRSFLKARRVGSSAYLILIKWILRTAYMVLLFLAWKGPSFGKQEKEVKAIAKDIYVAFDLSKSMNANDVQPSRLEKAKFELKRLVKAFRGDQIGLIIFSSEAFVQCPITYDHSALNMFLETLTTKLVPGGGTDLAKPLELALEKHTENENIGSNSKVVIIISDGEDFSDNVMDIAEELKENKIKVFTLGVGSHEGSRIPTGRDFKRGKNGEYVISKLDGTQLKQLAEKTGGKYFEINPNKVETEVLINTIKKIKGEIRDAKKMDVSNNKFIFFLLPALVLILIDFLFKINVIKIT